MAEVPWLPHQGAQMILFGGEAEGGLLLGDTAVLAVGDRPGDLAWVEPVLERTDDGLPLPRSGAAGAVVCNDSLGSTSWFAFIFGGRVDTKGSRSQADPGFRKGTGGLMNDLWVLKPTPEVPRTPPAQQQNSEAEPAEAQPPPPPPREANKLTWSRVHAHGRPPLRREGATMIAAGAKVLLTGGWIGGKPTQGSPWARDLWLFDTNTMTWTSLSFFGHCPSGRFGHNALLADFKASVGEKATLRAAQGSEDAVATMVDSKGRNRMVVSMVAGRVVDLIIDARDGQGLRAARAGDIFRVALEPVPSGGPDALRLPTFYPAIHDNGDGTYSVQVTAAAAGEYLLVVRSQEGLSIQGSPVAVVVDNGVAAASRCMLEGKGFVRATMGEVAEFQLCKRDLCGNIVPPAFDDEGNWTLDSDDVSVTVVGPNGEEVKARVLPDEDRYKVGWVPTLSGRYHITVRVKKQHIPNSPFKVPVAPGATDVGLSKLSGQIMDLGRWHAGAPTKLRLRAMDSFSNQRTKGGDKWGLKFERMEILPDGDMLPTGDQFGVEGHQVVDNRDGTYTIIFTPYESGTCSLSVVSLNLESKGKHVEGSPVRFAIKYGVLDAEQSTTMGPGITGEVIDGRNGIVHAGEEQEFLFSAMDMYRNRASAPPPLPPPFAASTPSPSPMMWCKVLTSPALPCIAFAIHRSQTGATLSRRG